MVKFNLKVLAKFRLCSNCSQKFDGCSLARAHKIFATACQMLVLAKINTLLACSHARRCSQRPFYIPLIIASLFDVTGKLEQNGVYFE